MVKMLNIYAAHLKVKITHNHTIIPLPRDTKGSFPLPDGQMKAIIRGKLSPLTF